MITQTHPSPGKFSTYLAVTSFGIGTLLLLIHLCFPDNINILIMGLYYVLFAAILNFITLVHLLYHLIINPFERKNIAIRILILLMNIPVTFLYISIVFRKH
jgi:membrane-bound ClpP family serine protease